MSSAITGLRIILPFDYQVLMKILFQRCDKEENPGMDVWTLTALKPQTPLFFLPYSRATQPQQAGILRLALPLDHNEIYEQPNGLPSAPWTDVCLLHPCQQIPGVINLVTSLGGVPSPVPKCPSVLGGGLIPRSAGQPLNENTDAMFFKGTEWSLKCNEMMHSGKEWLH